MSGAATWKACQTSFGWEILLPVFVTVHFFGSPLFCGLASSVIRRPFSSRFFLMQVFSFFFFFCCYKTYLFVSPSLFFRVCNISCCCFWNLNQNESYTASCPATCGPIFCSPCCCVLKLAVVWLLLGAHGPYTMYRNSPKIAEYFLCSLILQLQADIGPYSVEVCVIVHTAAILIFVLVGIINFTVLYACYPHV